MTKTQAEKELKQMEKDLEQAIEKCTAPKREIHKRLMELSDKWDEAYWDDKATTHDDDDYNPENGSEK